MKNVLSIIILFLMPFALWAQPKEQMIKVLVAPDHEDWRYALGENVKFDIKVVKNSVLLQNVDIYYEVSYDMMTPLKKKKAIYKFYINNSCYISG